MKRKQSLIILMAAILSVSCDKQKLAIEKDKDATQESIDNRKAEVDAAAKVATRKTDTEATLDKAKIEASKDSIQAQLDADKKKADAEADAAKAKVDAENK
jgi:hypothetical protein